MIPLIILLIMLLLIAAFGFFIAAHIMRIPRHSLEAVWKWQAEHYDISWYDGLEKADYAVRSYDGYTLHAQLLRNPVPSNRCVILSHGYTDNRFGTLKYARLYLDLGFNCVIYDMRGHGLNEPTFCTYSIRESRDLVAVIGDTRKRLPGLELLGLHGESLGASTTVASLRYRPDVDFAVADCGFAHIEPILRAGLKRFHIPGWFYPIARLCARLRYGYDYADMTPIGALSGIGVPIMFIHGGADGFIPPSHSQEMARAAGDKATLHIVPGARHARSVLFDTEGYRQCLSAFISAVKTHDN